MLKKKKKTHELKFKKRDLRHFSAQKKILRSIYMYTYAYSPKVVGVIECPFPHTSRYLVLLHTHPYSEAE